MTATAATQKFFQTVDFLVRQTSQRGALTGDACFGADIDQLLAVYLQFFRERIDTSGQF
jgi:hypothetical protein